MEKKTQEEIKDIQSSLNLKYLVSDEAEKSVSLYSIVFGGLFVIFILILAYWLLTENTQQDIVLHRIRPGDTLRKLAHIYYNNPNEWKRIFIFNRDRLIKNSKIKIGDILVIPIKPEEKKRLLKIYKNLNLKKIKKE